MLCATCNEPTEMDQISFRPNGMVQGIAMAAKKGLCPKCVRAIDNTSRQPGEDDEPIPTSEW